MEEYDTVDVRKSVRKTTILQYMVRRGPEKDPPPRLELANTTTHQISQDETGMREENITFEEAGTDGGDDGPDVPEVNKEDAVVIINDTNPPRRESGTLLTENSSQNTSPSGGHELKLREKELMKTTLARVKRGGVLNGPQKPKGVSLSNTPPPKKLEKVCKVGAKKKKGGSLMNTPPPS